MRRLKTLYLLGWVIIPGYWTLTGPGKVMRYEGEALTVQCHYEKSFKNNTKFWCKGSVLTLCSSSLIKTASESFVEKDRVSIRDNKEECYFEITMDKLKREDSDTYQCGIERVIFNDRHYIQVTISPDPKKTPTTEEVLTSTPTPASEKSKERELYILIYCIIPLFLLLIAAAVVLLVVSRKKKKGSGWKRKKEIKLESTVLAHNTADAGSKQSISLHHLGSDETGLYSNAEVHPENNYEEPPSQEKSPGNRDEVSYATVNISDPQHQFIYANTGFVSSPVLSQSHEVLYAKVAKRSTE